MDNDQIVGFSVTLAVFTFTDKSLQLIVIGLIRHTQGKSYSVKWKPVTAPYPPEPSPPRYYKGDWVEFFPLSKKASDKKSKQTATRYRLHM